MMNYLNDLDTLFMYLSSYFKIDLYERESLIIFDEVQLCSRARSAIKYLEYLYTNYILHIDNLKEENGILFLPLYMTCLL